MQYKPKKEINITVGESIRKYRDISGYTQDKFAELIDKSTNFVAQVESGCNGVSLTTLKKICEVLGVSADRILWKNESEITISEKLSHIDPKYLPVIEDVIQKQLEVIALAEKEEKRKKTRN